MSRFKGKPVGGLPGRLPEGEKIIWQGAPEWRSLARYVFHLKMVAVYFGLLVIWRVVGASMSGHTMAYALTSGVSSILLGAAAIALFSLFAWLIARTTTYSITTRRLVITYGMALPKSLNLPFANIDGADLRYCAEAAGADPAFLFAALAACARRHGWTGRAGAALPGRPATRRANADAIARRHAGHHRARDRHG
jgi:hypothetical protein